MSKTCDCGNKATMLVFNLPVCSECYTAIGVDVSADDIEYIGEEG